MSSQIGVLLASALDELRYEPIGKRIRAVLGGSYQDPLHDAAPVRGYVAFFNERVDVFVDGERHERPVTPWS
jgi:hypothetical protein